MKAYRSALTAALIGCGVLSAATHAQARPGFHFSGFGTVGAVHSNDETSDFVSSTFQPSGAGRSGAWSTTPDSTLGLQADMVATDKLSGVVQVISKYRYDGSYRPEVEWANAKYRFSDAWSVRLGRIALPTFLFSETRLVSYPNLWVRPPQEVYGTVTITHNDGVDVSHHSNFGGVNNTVQAYYGESVGKAHWGRFKSKQGVGIYNTVETSSVTVRAGVSRSKIDMSVPGAQASFDGLRAISLAYPNPTGAQAAALANRYRSDDIPVTVISLAATYDPGRWLITGEYVDFRGGSILVDNRAWYLSSGYRLGKFTPYVSYAKVSSDLPQESIDPTFAPATVVVAGLNTTLRYFSASQQTAALGVRWDAEKDMAVKLQLDQIRVEPGSPGRFKVPLGALPKDKVNVISLSLDFVF